MCLLVLLMGCGPNAKEGWPPLTSPDGKVELGFALSAEGRPQYWVRYDGGTVVDTSTLGLALKDMPPLDSGFEVVGQSADSLDEEWALPWGERESQRNHYRGRTIRLAEKAGSQRRLDIELRAYDDGVAFRYVIPQQPHLQAFTLADENTTFRLDGDNTCWWIPGDWDSYEHLYNETPLSKIDALSKRGHPNLVCSTIPYNAVATPLTMRTPAGLHLSIHEAALYDYPEMTLALEPGGGLRTELVGRKDSMKADLAAPFGTPWRMIQIAPTAAGLMESGLLLNLNAPSKLADVSWFKPQVYMGIWWEMHLGKASWDMASGKHGATTANAKRYIDFAAAHGIHALLIEGWNTGWERWMGFPDREGIFDFVTSYPDYDLEEVVRYGRSKGVELIMHHETSAAPRTYAQQLDTAYALMQRLGIHAAKTGYVGPILPEGEHHGGQWMVRHYQQTVEAAARHQVALDIHEPIKDTGIRRTWPNLVAREGLRGQEFNAWSTDGGNPAAHHTIVPFTCGLSGPLDYTPGIFQLLLKPYKPDNRVNTTLAHQLALYVVIYSPVQMAADLPEHYEGHPAFAFIEQVKTDWAETRCLAAEIGRYAIVARRARGSQDWWVGAVTNGDPRTPMLKLDFLPAGKTFQALRYLDAPDADWLTNPTAIAIDSMEVTSADEMALRLAPGGGAAIRLRAR